MRTPVRSPRQDIVEFLAALLSGNTKWDEALDKAVANDFLVAAEKLVADEETFGMNVESLKGQMAADAAPPVPTSVPAVPVQVPAEPEPKAQAPKDAEPAQTDPDPVDAAEAAENTKPASRATSVPSFCLTQCQRDMLDRLPDDEWEKALQYARTSVSANQTLRGW